MNSSHGFRESKGFTIAVLCIATFTDVMVYGLVIPVLPFALSERIKSVPENQVQRWNSILLGIYAAAAAIGSIVFGWIGDRASSRRAPFILGLVLLGASTAIFAAARSLLVLVLARVLQGLAASVPATVGIALLLDKVGPEGIGEALGWTSVFLTLGFFLGPVIGGILYQLAGYVPVFIPTFVLVFIEIGLRAMVVEERISSEESTPILRAGISYSTLQSEATACPCPLSPTASAQDSKSQSESDAICRFQIFILLRQRRLLVAQTALMILASFNGVLESVLPLYCHEIFGLRSSSAALVFIPSTIPVLFSPYVGKFVDRHGPRGPALLAYGGAVIIFLLLGCFTRNAPLDIVLLINLLFCFGSVSTCASPAMMSEITRAITDIEEKEPGVFGPSGSFSLGSGLNHCTYMIGMFLGTMYGALLRETLGWTVLCCFMALLSLFALALIVMVTGKASIVTTHRVLSDARRTDCA